MEAREPSPDIKPGAPTFSLGTLMLVITTACIGFAGFRFSPGDVWVGIGIAIFFASVFLAAWFVATKRFRYVRFPLWSIVVGLLILLIAPAVHVGQGPRRIPPCAINLRYIGLALLSYHEKYGSFPPAYVADAKGKPLYSWRALILPELEEQPTYSKLKLDEPWDGPNNASLAKTTLLPFVCPSDPQSRTLAGSTSYLAVVGPRTAWSGTTPRKLSEIKVPSETILVVEAENSGVNWAEPRDLYVGQMPMAINSTTGQGISSGHGDYVYALFADGSVRSLPDNINPKILAKLLDIDGVKDKEELESIYWTK